MRMTNEIAAASLHRVLALFHGTEAQAFDYVESVVEAVGWMRPERFEEVCKEILKEMSPGRRPVPSQFISMYRRLSERLHWTETPTQGCSGCNGKRLVSSFFKHRDTDELIESMTPCPLCRLNERTEPPEVLIPITPEVYHEARRPEHERKVRAGWLKLWGFDAGGMSMEDCVAILMERMKEGKIDFDRVLKPAFPAQESEAELMHRRNEMLKVVQVSEAAKVGEEVTE